MDGKEKLNETTREILKKIKKIEEEGLAHPVVITADDSTPPENHDAIWVHG